MHTPILWTAGILAAFTIACPSTPASRAAPATSTASIAAAPTAPPAAASVSTLVATAPAAPPVAPPSPHAELEPPAPAGAPFGLTSSDGEGLKFSSLQVSALVDRPLAYTELRMTFENPADRVREGRFEITLPAGASVARFAMRLDGRWQEGEMVERRTAQRAYDDFLHRRQDPALLEHEAGNSFAARVFPIPAHGRKDLILAYSQELKGGETYRVPLRGLPGLGQYRAHVLVREGGAERAIEATQGGWVPDVDLTVAPPRESPSAVRSGQQIVARVTVPGDASPDELGSVAMLVDTSASRAAGFEHQVAVVHALLAALPAATPVLVAAYDQDVAPLYEGVAEGFDPKALIARRPLGATDVERAMAWLGEKMKDKPYARVLLVSDGVITAGAENQALSPAAAALARAGAQRLDAIALGGIRDDAALARLTRSGFAHEGITVSGELPMEEILRRLRTKARSGLKVGLEGGAWVRPAVLDGVQPGDEVLIHGEVPEAAPVTVTLDGQRVLSKPATPAEAPLVGRACAAARIAHLEDEVAALAPKDREHRLTLNQEMIRLSTTYRVSSPLTAFLVLETNEDYQRYGIDRHAAGDIWTVSSHGLVPVKRGELDEETKRLWQADKEPVKAVDAPAKKNKAKPSEEGTFGKKDALAEAAERAALPEPGSPPPAEPPMEMQKAAAPMRAMPSEAAMDMDTLEGALAGAPPSAPVGGLSGIGMGGGGVGYGSAVGIRHGAGAARGSVAQVQTSDAALEVSGDLDRAALMRVVRVHVAGVRACYERELTRNPGTQGRVAVRFTITANGEVANPSSTENGTGSNELATCVVNQLRRWQFPSHPGGDITVSYPFVFSLPDGDAPSSSPPAVSAAAPVEITPADAPVAMSLTRVDGPLGREALAADLAKLAAPLRACFHSHDWTREAPAEAPTFEVSLGISPLGKVNRVGITPTTPATLVKCLSTRFKAAISSSKPSDEVSSTVQVTYTAGAWNDYRPRSDNEEEAIKPWTGKFNDVMSQLKRGEVDAGLSAAVAWHEEQPGDVLALVALGEAREAKGDGVEAARAYGSIIDLFPGRADLRRFAGNRLERVGADGRARELAIDTYRHAVEERPDHPSSHHLLGMALLRAGRPAEAFAAFAAGAGREYPSDRFLGSDRILSEDLGLAAAAWKKAEPSRAAEIAKKLASAKGSPETGASVRFVLSWETDGNDVDFHIHDRHGQHAFFQAMHLESGGNLYADVTTGYGPECFTVRGPAAARAYPYWLDAHYYSRGPMGYGMGQIEVIEHDGHGGFEFQTRPFVVMQDQAFVDVGKLGGSLQPGRPPPVARVP